MKHKTQQRYGGSKGNWDAYPYHLDGDMPTISEMKDKQRHAELAEFALECGKWALIVAIGSALLIVSIKALGHYGALTCGVC